MAVSQSLTLSQVSQSVANNTSQVRILWTSTQNGDSHNDYTKTAYYYVSVNGGAETKYSVSYTLPQNTTKTIVDTTVTVNHNDEGKCSVTVRTWMSTDISAGVVELSKSLTLTDIPRASTITATNADIGSASVIAVSRKSNAYTHSISYQFGSLSGYITADGTVSASEVKHTATSILFVVPTDFYGEIPDEPGGRCTLICRTYSGSTQIGSNSFTFYAKASETECKPEISGTVVDTNEAAIALTGNPDTLIRYVSTAHCEISVTVKNGASISDRTINGISIGDADHTLDIENVNTDSFEFYAIDSRKYPDSYPVTKTLIPYVILTCNASAARTDPTSGNAVLHIEGKYYDGSFGAQSNTLTLTYSVDDGTAIPVTASVNGSDYTADVNITGLDYQNSHSIYVIAADKVGSVPKTVPVGKGIPVFDWGENDFAFHVPIGMGGNGITGLPTPAEESSAVPLGYAQNAFSPAAYGFGNFVPIPLDSDLNDYYNPGAYGIQSNEIANSISNIPEAKSGILYIVNAAGMNTIAGTWKYARQIYIPYSETGRFYGRTFYKGSTEEWIYDEWEVNNPPMAVGVEYRTMERFMGKPVYAKLVSLGAAPNAAYKTVSGCYSGAKYVTSCTGIASQSSGYQLSFPTFDNAGKGIGLWAYANGNIAICANYNASAYTICYALVKYIKN